MRSVRLWGAWLIAGVSVCVLGFLLVTGQPFTAKAQEPKRFQYRIIEVLPDTKSMQTRLNQFGASGWELVTLTTGELVEPRMIFKK